MPAESPGSVWAAIWEEGVWAAGVWATNEPPPDPVDVDRRYKASRRRGRRSA